MSMMGSQINSLARLFTQLFIQGADQRNIKVPHQGPFEGNSPVTGEIPAQTASDVENVSIWWRHHELFTVMADNTDPTDLAYI